jgi:hypothetical protein
VAPATSKAARIPRIRLGIAKRIRRDLTPGND